VIVSLKLASVGYFGWKLGKRHTLKFICISRRRMIGD